MSSNGKGDRGARLGYRSKLAAAGFVKASAVLIFVKELTDGAFRVLQAIHWHAGPTDTAWPGQDTLAEELSMSERTVQRHIADLKRLGLLTVAPKGQGHTADYILEDIPQALIEGARLPGWYQRERAKVRPARNGGSYSERTRVAGLGRTRVSVQERTPVAVPTLSNQDPTEEDPAEAGAFSGDHNGGATDGPYPAYLAGVVLDLAREVLQERTAAGAVTQAINLWRGSGLSEQVFVDLVYQARAELRKQQSSIRNRGGWFFARLGTLIAEYTKGGDLQQ